MKKSYFDRPMSDAIKGVALILMFVHHFFTFPDYYIQNPTFLILGSVRTALCGPTRICVSVFAFLTGYFYCLGSRKTYGYSLKKIGNFLVSYWLVYLPFLLLAVGLGCYSLGTGALLGAFGLDSEVMTFCWYVYFYCAAMLLLPLTERLSTGSLWRDALLLGVLPLMAVTAIREALPDNVAGALAAVVQEWYPCVHVGWLMCRYDIFEEIQESTGGRQASTWKSCILWFTMACLVCLARAVCPRVSIARAFFRGYWLDIPLNMDVFYAPIFLWCLKHLLDWLSGTRLFRLLGEIGRESMGMWFFHCLFFNCCAEYTQPLLCWPRLAVPVLLWGLLLCYIGARLVGFFRKRLVRK